MSYVALPGEGMKGTTENTEKYSVSSKKWIKRQRHAEVENRGIQTYFVL